MSTLARAAEYLVNSAVRDQVGGYLQETQALAIHALLRQQDEAGLVGSLAEIGVFKGKTLIGMARAARPGELVVGVDPMMIGAHDLTPELRANVERWLTPEERSRLILKRALSTDLQPPDWAKLLHSPARFVHLDGHHAKQTILHDLKLAACHLAKHGIIVIDDFLNELHPDLTAGIFEGLAALPELQPIAVIPRRGSIDEGGSKLVCTTRGDGAPYIKALDVGLAAGLRPWVDHMLGHEVRVYRTKAAPEPPRIPVVFALRDEDGFYWPNTAVAITSLAEHATIPISVHILHDETLIPTARKRFQRIAEDLNFPLHLKAVTLPNGIEYERLTHFGAASLYRLMIPSLFREHALVIYLDSDVVLNGLDIRNLVEQTPQDAALSAVVDPYIGVAESHRRSLAELGIDIDGYFNSGVLALRPGMLPQNLLWQFMAWSDENPTAIHPDQDFLNARFQATAHRLAAGFNVQVGLRDQGLIRPLSRYHGLLLHYVGALKPLTGTLAPGTLPFWMHAHRVPELHRPEFHRRAQYILPEDSDKNSARDIVIEWGARTDATS